MKTTVYLLALLVLMAHLVNAPESRGEETAKMGNDVSANKLESGEPSEGFSLSIQVKRAENRKKWEEDKPLDVAKTVQVIATLVNVSQDKLLFVETNATTDFLFTVLDSEGKPVPRTQYGKQLLQWKEHTPQLVGDITLWLSPGESRKYEFNLSRRFDLSLAGAYSVESSCKVPKKAGPGLAELKSNTLAFELR